MWGLDRTNINTKLETEISFALHLYIKAIFCSIVEISLAAAKKEFRGLIVFE